MANSVDPDETPRSAASHLGLYCLLRPVCPNIYGKYGIHKKRKNILQISSLIWNCENVKNLFSEKMNRTLKCLQLSNFRSIVKTIDSKYLINHTNLKE